jgi:uncharacterized protein YfkK (UPF0435 family)
MPSLPRKNTLDYNPDSMVNASKKIRTIALENMKNPILDPDQATLSTIDATRRLGDSIDALDYLAGLFHSAVLKIQNLVAPAVGSGRKVGGGPKKTSSSASSDYGSVESDSSYAPSASASSKSRSVHEYNTRLQALKDQRNRFTDRFLEIGSQNSQAKGVPSSVGSREEEDEMEYPSSATEYASSGSFDDGEDYDNTSWVASIFYLIQLTRKMDILVVSKIKPNSNSLSQAQITKLGDIYKLVKTSYDDITDPFTRRRGKTTDPYTKVERNVDEDRAYGDTNIEKHYIHQKEFGRGGNEYGDEIINTFNSERKKLLLEITVVVSSWKQNSATGQQTEMAEDLTKDYETTAGRNKQLYIESDGDYNPVGAGRMSRSKKSGRLHLLGAGNNFYGEKIDNSNDIPCLLSSIKNCPTKYLL